jgi:hypothetical protein
MDACSPPLELSNPPAITAPLTAAEFQERIVRLLITYDKSPVPESIECILGITLNKSELDVMEDKGQTFFSVNTGGWLERFWSYCDACNRSSLLLDWRPLAFKDKRGVELEFVDNAIRAVGWTRAARINIVFPRNSILYRRGDYTLRLTIMNNIVTSLFQGYRPDDRTLLRCPAEQEVKRAHKA